MLNGKQVEQLLKPIHPRRILKAQGHSHVSQQDILAHLIRVFGFGNFDIDVLSAELIFESEKADQNGVANGRFDVCYKALVRLTIRDLDGNKLCHYENGSTAVAQNQSRGDGHDLAYKSAISLSVKRAAIALGDQFGLSLYNKGQETALVMNSLAYLTDKADVQEGVEQQLTLGNDEKEDEPSPEGVVIGSGKKGPAGDLDRTPAKPAQFTDEQKDAALAIFHEADAFDSEDGLKVWYEAHKALADVPVGSSTIKAEVTRKLKELRK
jgi:hypothetical protein